MKTKLFIVILLLIIGNIAIAQIDTLNVYLERNQEYRAGVDLVFENISNDTIFLPTHFQNFSWIGEISQSSGIYINFYYDDKEFVFSWEELPIKTFTFNKRFTLINPKSKLKLFFNVGEYFRFPDKSDKKFEVSFFMNYSFAKYLHPETFVYITYFQTNRVTIVEPTKEDEIINDENR